MGLVAWHIQEEQGEKRLLAKNYVKSAKQVKTDKHSQLYCKAPYKFF